MVIIAGNPVLVSFSNHEQVTEDAKVLQVITLKLNLLRHFSFISEESYSYGSHDTGDPSTTNLYIGNINPTVS